MSNILKLKNSTSLEVPVKNILTEIRIRRSSRFNTFSRAEEVEFITAKRSGARDYDSSVISALVSRDQFNFLSISIKSSGLGINRIGIFIGFKHREHILIMNVHIHADSFE